MIKWSGKTTSFHHSREDTPNPPDVPKGIRPVFIMDVQGSTCPIEVKNEVSVLWRDRCLGNDDFAIFTTINKLLADEELQVSAIVQYATEQGIAANAELIIRWWW